MSGNAGWSFLPSGTCCWVSLGRMPYNASFIASESSIVRLWALGPYGQPLPEDEL